MHDKLSSKSRAESATIGTDGLAYLPDSGRPRLKIKHLKGTNHLGAAEVKTKPTTASKRKSPVQPSLQPTAKRGRLLRQKSPSISTEAASVDSDATMEECVSPSRQGRGKKNALESDDDEDYVPG